MLVFCGHFHQVFIQRIYMTKIFEASPPLIYQILTQIPSFSVMTFFVLSGFLIAYSTFVDMDKDIEQRFSLATYIWKRATRILPPLYFSIFLTVGIVLVIHWFHLYGSVTYKIGTEYYAIRDKAEISTAQIVTNMAQFPPCSTL